MEQGVGNTIIAECKRKKNDKAPAVFYADHMEYNGESYKYGEMDTVSLYASAMRYGILMENFSGFIKMTFRDGRKLKWKIAGNAFLGFGKNKLKREYYANMYEACMLTFFKARAAEYLQTIRSGGDVTIANVNVSATEISGKSGLKKASTPISQLGGADRAPRLADRRRPHVPRRLYVGPMLAVRSRRVAHRLCDGFRH